MFIRVSENDPATLPPVYRVYKLLQSFVNECEKSIPRPVLFLNNKYQHTWDIIRSLRQSLSLLQKNMIEYEMHPKQFSLTGGTESEMRDMGQKIDVAQQKMEQLKLAEREQITVIINKIQETMSAIKSVEKQEMDITTQIIKSETTKNLLLNELKANTARLSKERDNILAEIEKKWMLSKSLKENLGLVESKWLNAVNELKRVEEIEKKKKAELNGEMNRLANKKIDLHILEKKLIEQLARLPEEVKSAKNHLESLERIAVNRINQLEDMPDSAISNRLMYDLLRVYVEFVDLKMAIRHARPPYHLVTELESTLTINKERELDDLLKYIWCPASGDRNCIDLYATIDLAKKTAILITRTPTVDQLNRIVPNVPGNFWRGYMFV